MDKETTNEVKTLFKYFTNENLTNINEDFDNIYIENEYDIFIPREFDYLIDELEEYLEEILLENNDREYLVERENLRTYEEDECSFDRFTLYFYRDGEMLTAF